MSSKVRERVLLYRLQIHRDSEAFAELYDIFAPRIYRFVFFKVNSPEDAEDITAETFLKAWHYITEEHVAHNFNALLYRIARNLVIDYYRARKTSQGIEQEDLSFSPELPLYNEDKERESFGNSLKSNLPNPHEQVEAQEVESEVMEAMRQLKDEYREVLTMRYIDGLSVGEIAEVLDKSNVSVRVTQHRALAAMQRIMKNNPQGPVPTKSPNK